MVPQNGTKQKTARRNYTENNLSVHLSLAWGVWGPSLECSIEPLTTQLRKGWAFPRAGRREAGAEEKLQLRKLKVLGRIQVFPPWETNCCPWDA